MQANGWRATARIDLAAIRQNLVVLTSRYGIKKYVADIAADAYGHGASEVGRLAREAAVTVSESSNPLGAELYGLTRDPLLHAAMRVSALVIATKTIDAGEGVSYGYTWHASTRTNLALVGIGYADGLDRSASNVGSLLLGGVEHRIVGRVAMNALVLDLGQHSAAIGDEAVVFGDQAVGEPAVWDWARQLERPCAEIVAVFGSHLPREYRW